MPQGSGISCKACFFLKRLEWWPVHWCLDCEALLNLLSCKSDSWRRYTLKWLATVVIFMGFGGANSLGTHWCHHLGWQYKPQRGGAVLMGKGGSLPYWKFIVNLTGYCKKLYSIHLFPILLLFYLFCIY